MVADRHQGMVAIRCDIVAKRVGEAVMTGQAAPALILVHGFLDSGEVWRPILNILGTSANGWSTPDLPGMGKLWDTEGPFSLRRHADAITARIDQLSRGGRVPVGHV